MNIAEILKNSPLFAGMTAADLETMGQIVRCRDHVKGELLFSEGEEAEGFYVVFQGRVKVYKLSPEGKERILHIVGPGGTFAEAAIFGNGEYPAYAEPVVKSALIFIPKEGFLNLLRSNGQMAINMIAGMSRFLRQFATQIEELTFKDVPSRLARYLLELTGNEEAAIELPISKAQLASNLGTVSETLSRTLRKLVDEGLINVQGRRVEILDYDRLADLAEKCKEN